MTPKLKVTRKPQVHFVAKGAKVLVFEGPRAKKRAYAFVAGIPWWRR